MADDFLGYQSPSVVDERLDTESLTVGALNVHRERIQVTGTGATDIAPVSATDGLLVNLGANNDVTVTGSVTATGPLTDAQLRATPVPISGTVTANAGTNLNTSALALEAGNLATVAGIVTSARAAVNPISGQVGVQGASGAVTALTQRVVLATDVGLPTGTNSIGQVTANAGTNLNTSLLALEAGGNLAAAAASLSVIDDWDETDRAKVNPIVGQAGVQGGAGAVSALTQRVVLATDQTVIPVSDNASSLTVDNGGTFVVQENGAALTALQLIDDIVATAGSTAATKVNQEGLTAFTVLPTAVTDGQAVRAMGDSLGRMVTISGAPRALQVKAVATLSSSTEVTILGAGASGIFHDLMLLTIANTLSSDATISVRDSTAGSLIHRIYAPGKQTVGFAAQTPVIQTTAANNWTAQADHGAGGIHVFAQAIKAR